MRLPAFLVLLAVCGCSSGIQKPAAPKDVIARDSMVVVLRELVVLEAHAETRYQRVQNYYKMMDATGKACLEKHHISPDRFSRSFDYYASHQEELQSIYTEVMDSINMEVNRLGIQQGNPANKAGSNVGQSVVDPFPDN